MTSRLPDKGALFDEITIRTEDSSTAVTAQLEVRGPPPYSAPLQIHSADDWTDEASTSFVAPNV